jgi:hypothetical protein
MRFDLASLLYIQAITVVSLLVGEASWFILCLIIILCWTIIPHLPLGPVGFWAAWVGLMVLGATFVFPSTGTSLDAARSQIDLWKLKQMSIAILNYESASRQLPPVVTRDSQGDALHSWRTLILPYMEESGLHGEIDFRQAWNSNHNQRFTTRPIDAYCDGLTRSPTANTKFFAVVGPETVWREHPPFSFKDLKGGTSNETIVIIEAAQRNVPWGEPKDLSFEEAVEILTSPIEPKKNGGRSVRWGILYKPINIRHVANLDGSVRTLRAPLMKDEAIALLSADKTGKGKINWELIEARVPKQFSVAGCTLFAVMLALSVAPACWVRKAYDAGVTTNAGIPGVPAVA